VVKLETLYGVTLGVNYGDTLVFGKRTQEKKATLLFGAFVPNLTNQRYYLMTERENFYKWMETCPLTDYRICGATTTSVAYEFNFNSVEPDIDQLIDDVLNHLEK
jgi:hypothetical protein